MYDFKQFINDDDYGLCKEKPIYVKGRKGECDFFRHLTTLDGEQVYVKIIEDSIFDKKVIGLTTAYEIYVNDVLYKTLYLNRSGEETNVCVPKGFKLREKEKPKGINYLSVLAIVYSVIVYFLGNELLGNALSKIENDWWNYYGTQQNIVDITVFFIIVASSFTLTCVAKSARLYYNKQGLIMESIAIVIVTAGLFRGRIVNIMILTQGAYFNVYESGVLSAIVVSASLAISFLIYYFVKAPNVLPTYNSKSIKNIFITYFPYVIIIVAVCVGMVGIYISNNSHISKTMVLDKTINDFVVKYEYNAGNMIIALFLNFVVAFLPIISKIITDSISKIKKIIEILSLIFSCGIIAYLLRLHVLAILYSTYYDMSDEEVISSQTFAGLMCVIPFAVFLLIYFLIKPINRAKQISTAKKDRVKCSKCGKDIDSDSAFCKYCGSKIDKSCVNCGKKIDEDAAFCKYCGTPVK